MEELKQNNSVNTKYIKINKYYMSLLVYQKLVLKDNDEYNNSQYLEFLQSYILINING